MKLQYKIINTLIRHGYLLTEHVNEDQYYFESEKVKVQYVTPHEGTNNNHTLRAELIEDFHKFEDAQFKKFIKGDIDIISAVIELDTLEMVKK